MNPTGWADAGFCAFWNNVDLDNEMLYNVKVSTNTPSRIALQARIKQILGLDNIMAINNAADEMLAAFFMLLLVIHQEI